MRSLVLFVTILILSGASRAQTPEDAMRVTSATIAGKLEGLSVRLIIIAN